MSKAAERSFARVTKTLSVLLFVAGVACSIAAVVLEDLPVSLALLSDEGRRSSPLLASGHLAVVVGTFLWTLAHLHQVMDRKPPQES